MIRGHVSLSDEASNDEHVPEAILKVGCHLSIAGGLFKAIDRARDLGCTAFQIFTSNPRGWACSDISTEDRERFAQIDFANAHMPYLPNLAAPNPEIHKRSVETMTRELERCEALSIRLLVTHLGSHLGQGEKEGRERIVSAIKEALSRAESQTMILLENTAGTKNSLGTRPDELAMILDALDGSDRVGVCIDTAHAFAAGYDWRSDENPFYAELEAARISSRIRVLHLNDSKVALGKRADRHDHIGLGEIGTEGLKKAVTHPIFRHLPIILETPDDERRSDRENIAAARALII